MPEATSPRRILFLTGTRADFGKLKPLIRAIDKIPDFACSVVVTGMHMMDIYGHTLDEVHKAGFTDIHSFSNQSLNDPMEVALANTIQGLSQHIHGNPPDMIVVHGDRIEALAGSIVGALRNVVVGHIEGGEISGTVDELIRHAVSKLSHLHFVANEDAASRLRQLGEIPGSIFVIGSPDTDVMASHDLPSVETVKAYYDIPFGAYAIATFHPVTTEIHDLPRQAAAFVDALLASGRDFVVIYPNNDEGSSIILNELQRIAGSPRFRVFPSMRFEYYLSLLKHCDFIVGNSSSGVREAPFYGLPSVNVGTRQQSRFSHTSILDVGNSADEIVSGMAAAGRMGRIAPSLHFGDGQSCRRFVDILQRPSVWQVPKQKRFNDLPLSLLAAAS